MNTTDFVTDKHLEALKKVCETENIITTIRETGKQAVQWISDGHPCKGHDVLDRTYPKFLDNQTNVQDKFRGLVGKKEGERIVFITAKDNGDNGQIAIDEIKGFIPKNTYTGDYDLHDVAYAKSIGSGTKSGSIFLSKDTVQQTNIMIKLKKATSELGNTDERYSAIRHGSQRNFYAQAKYKKENPILRVLQMDSPLLAIFPVPKIDTEHSKQIAVQDENRKKQKYQKGYLLLNSVDEIVAFYKFFNITIPNYWCDFDIAKEKITELIKTSQDVSNSYLLDLKKILIDKKDVEGKAQKDIEDLKLKIDAVKKAIQKYGV